MRSAGALWWPAGVATTAHSATWTVPRRGDNNRYPLGRVVELNVVSGHRDASYTLCAGKCLYPLLAQIRSEAATSMGRPGPLRSVRPARILDTRSGLGTAAGLVRSGQSRAFRVTGVGGVPASGVGTVVLNLTAIHTTAPAGSLVAFPDGVTPPTAADLSFSGNQIVSNLVVVRLSAAGALSLANLGSDATNVLIDVEGFSTMGS